MVPRVVGRGGGGEGGGYPLWLGGVFSLVRGVTRRSINNNLFDSLLLIDGNYLVITVISSW